MLAQKTTCCNKGRLVALFEQSAREDHATLPNNYFANSPGSTPVAMSQEKAGIPHDINLAQSTLQPEPLIVSTLESASVHTPNLPPHCRHFSSAIQRHTMTPFTRAVDSILKQYAAWIAMYNIVKGFSISPRNRSNKSKPNPTPPTYL